MQGGDTRAEQRTISTTAPPSNQAPSTSTPEEEEEEEEEDEEDSEPMAVDREDQKKPAPCLGSSPPSPASPRPPSAPADTQGCPSADEADCRALPQSEEEEDEEEDEEEEEDDDEDGGEPMKCLRVKIKQEPVERQVKVELLDEASNMSPGDGSSSGFLGSPAEPDPQDFCLLPARRSRADSLLTETDDSLPFEPHKCDGEKLRRRGSPGRSRIKQVLCSSLESALHNATRSMEGISRGVRRV